jgi:hypothetical protein
MLLRCRLFYRHVNKKNIKHHSGSSILGSYKRFANAQNKKGLHGNAALFKNPISYEKP